MGSIFSGLGAKKAAKTTANASLEAARIQSQASDRATAEDRRQHDLARQDFYRGRDAALASSGQGYTYARNELLPLLEGTDDARQAILFENGLADAPENYRGFQATPGYEFLRDEGSRGINNRLAAMGLSNSGAALRETQRFQTGLADQEYDDHYNRLLGVSNQGAQVRGALSDIAANRGRDSANIYLGTGANVANSRLSEAGAVTNNIFAGSNALAQGTISAGNARAAGQQAVANIPGNTINELLGYASFGLSAHGALGGSSFAPSPNALAPNAGIGTLY